MRKPFFTISMIALVSLVLAACGPQATPSPQVTEEPTATEAPTEAPTAAPTKPPTPAWTAPEGALAATPVDTAPTLDGVADEVFWAESQEIVIPVSGGANNGSTEVRLKAVYTEDSVYFLATWADPTETFLRAPWQKQEDGTWIQLKDPNDRGGDNNLVYEDKLAFVWPIANSIPNFETQGCFTACHAGENSDVKPYGNKYTAEEGQTGDIWHWKSVRNLNQVDDQNLDSMKYSPDTPEAGRHSDPKDSGGYADNKTEDGKLPAYMSSGFDPKTGYPGFILDSEKVPFDDSEFVAGDYVPGIIKSEIVGERGDISAGSKYAEGTWTLEFGRELVTGSDVDVQFDDLTATYYFGVATFDNAQVRHAFQAGSSMLVFKPE